MCWWSAHRADASGNNSGAAYVYERDPATDTWSQAKKLVASDTAAHDSFGWAAAVSGDVVVVGANKHAASGSSSGAVYVFERDQGGTDNWGEVKKLVASDAAASAMFGRSVAVDADILVVGAIEADGTAVDSGAAYVFERDQGGVDNWGEVTKLVASDGALNDHFGSSVAISADVVAVGAVNADASGLDSGAAYVFARNQGGTDNWGEVTKVIGSDSATGDHLGGSVSVDGDVLVAGASRDYTNGTRTGSAHVFERDRGGTDNWGETKKLVASDFSTNARFGISVSVSGDVVVVGADRDSESASEAGAVYAFERDEGGTGNWGEVNKLVPASAAADDSFGWSVAAGPDLVAAGALESDAGVADAGAAFIFGAASTSPGEDAGVDTGPDASPDTGPDATVDTGPDATVDTGPDTSPDTGDDSGADADPVEDNRPPVFVSPTPEDGATMVVAVGDTLSMKLVAQDPDQDRLTYAVTPLPDEASLDTSSGAFGWTPTADDLGSRELDLTVTDGALSDRRQVTVEVRLADSDEDGVPDGEDACPFEPGDGDDGCPLESGESAATEDGCGCTSTSGPSDGLAGVLVLLGLAGLRLGRRPWRSAKPVE